MSDPPMKSTRRSREHVLAQALAALGEDFRVQVRDVIHSLTALVDGQ